MFTENIYNNARGMINFVMATMFARNILSFMGSKWSVTNVSDKLVIFKISKEVRDLLEKVPLVTSESCISFNFVEGKPMGEAIVKSDNIESYYFSRMLFYAMHISKNGLTGFDKAKLDRQIVKKYAQMSLEKNAVSNRGISVNVEFNAATGVYTLIIHSKNRGPSQLTGSDSNVDNLCLWIGRQLREGLF
jgi:hypothetical protein